MNSTYGDCLGISVREFRSTLLFLCPWGSGPPNPGGVPRLFVGHFRSRKGLTTLSRDFLLVLDVLCFGHKRPAKVAEKSNFQVVIPGLRHFQAYPTLLMDCFQSRLKSRSVIPGTRTRSQHGYLSSALNNCNQLGASWQRPEEPV